MEWNVLAQDLHGFFYGFGSNNLYSTTFGVEKILKNRANNKYHYAFLLDFPGDEKWFCNRIYNYCCYGSLMPNYHWLDTLGELL